MNRPAKPALDDLGVDATALAWRSSSSGPGAIEVAFVQALGQSWVLMRLTSDPDRRISVFSEFEWACFLDGARKGEFDSPGP